MCGLLMRGGRGRNKLAEIVDSKSDIRMGVGDIDQATYESSEGGSSIIIKRWPSGCRRDVWAIGVGAGALFSMPVS